MLAARTMAWLAMRAAVPMTVAQHNLAKIMAHGCGVDAGERADNAPLPMVMPPRRSAGM